MTDTDGLTDHQEIAVRVTDIYSNEPPQITNPAGVLGIPVTVRKYDNTTGVFDVETRDDADSEGSGLTYSLSGGADKALFSIDAATGVLRFRNPPDHERATSATGYNVYNVFVTVTDSGGRLSRRADVLQQRLPHVL